jgi:hypothetical protein
MPDLSHDGFPAERQPGRCCRECTQLSWRSDDPFESIDATTIWPIAEGPDKLDIEVIAAAASLADTSIVIGE